MGHRAQGFARGSCCLTPRCSGLASLAAELHIVRRHKRRAMSSQLDLWSSQRGVFEASTSTPFGLLLAFVLTSSSVKRPPSTHRGLSDGPWQATLRFPKVLACRAASRCLQRLRTWDPSGRSTHLPCRSASLPPSLRRSNSTLAHPSMKVLLVRANTVVSRLTLRSSGLGAVAAKLGWSWVHWFRYLVSSAAPSR